MHHYFEAITNNKGDALTGYFCRVVDPDSGSAVTLYADPSLTPIVSVSGVDDAAKVDPDGNVNFYVDVGTYHLDIYATDAATFIRRVEDVGMNIDADTAATAVAAQTAASASATAAATSEANAATSATNAGTHEDNAAAYDASAASHEAAAAISATNAANSEASASNFATTATNGANSAATSLAGVLSALDGTTLSSVTLSASSRPVLATLDHSTGIPAQLWEGVRQGVYLPMSAATYNAATGRTLTTDVPIDGGNLIIPYSGDSTGASGAWVYPYWGLDVSARLFGATDGTDVQAAVEAWSSAVWQLPCKSASCRVTGTAALPITVGTMAANKTNFVDWAPTINATAAMDVLVTMVNPPGFVTYGGSLWGNTSTNAGSAWADRLAGYGIVWENAQYSVGAGSIRISNFKYWGGYINDAIGANGNNSNYATLPNLRCHSCGLSSAAGGTSAMSANWSTPTRTGSSGVIGQGGTINVSAVPDADSVNGYSAWLFWINGYPYKVGSPTASGDPTYPYTLNIKNVWPSDAMISAGTGTGDYTIGGGLYVEGSDSSVIPVGAVFSVNCGFTFVDASLYGVTPRRISNDGGVDVLYAFGLFSNGAHEGGGFEEAYIEGTTLRAQVLSFAPTGSSGVRIGKFTGTAINFAKWFKHGPRGTGVTQPYYQLMSEIVSVVGYEGQAIIAQNGPTYTATYDPPSIASGALASTTITVGGVLPMGSTHRVKFNQALSGMAPPQAYVSNQDVSTSTMKIVFSNLTGGTVDPSSGTITVTLLQ